jgi:hypothetical protein
MTRVKQIEAAVGEHQSFPLAPKLPALLDELISVENLRHRVD